MSKGQVDVNVPESSSITTEDKNIILKAYSTQKVGSGGNSESGNTRHGTFNLVNTRERR